MNQQSLTATQSTSAITVDNKAETRKALMRAKKRYKQSIKSFFK
mgnify:CR=1 FL=1